MKSRLTLLLVLTTCLAPAGLTAQAPPLGPEFRMDSYSSKQFSPAIASRGDGSFVVVWGGSQSRSGLYGYGQVVTLGVAGQRFDSSGAKVGAQFLVGSHRTGSQGGPALAVSKTGEFVVVWGVSTQGYYSHIRYGSIFGQRFSGSGTRVGETFQVNTQTTNTQPVSSVAMDKTGNFIVVWQSRDGSGSSVFGQLFDRSGAKTNGRLRVNTETTGTRSNSSVAMNGTGSFVVVWQSEGGSSDGVFGQRFDRSGARVGTEFRAGTDRVGRQALPSVAMNEAGNFIVVWQSRDGSDSGIFGQRFDSSGAKTGAEFPINTYTAGFQGYPALSFSRTGDFVMLWVSDGQGGPGPGVFGQRFDGSGARIGSEFEVEAYRTAAQTGPRVVDDGLGLAVVWVSSSGSIIGRRQDLLPSAPVVDVHSGAGTNSNTNGILEPGETALVETSWSNVGADAITNLTGTASNLSGLAGLDSLDDASAAYGSLPAGSLGDCNAGGPGACFAITIGGPPRPATHWDAELQEDLSAGGTQVWKLHVGDSFTDVPRTQPFYAKIETLLHNGIASGCTTTQYCPGDPVLRGQLAIFIARALAGSGENVPATGAGYNCSAGGRSLFIDVAPTDIFCKHVHYLAARSVTLGCGGSRYCPGQTVTRDTMASFIANAIVAPGGDAAVPQRYADPMTALSYSCDAGSPNLHFIDVPASDPLCKHIHYLWARGVVTGCSATEFCPADPVNRDAMAKFIVNGFGLELYGP